MLSALVGLAGKRPQRSQNLARLWASVVGHGRPVDDPSLDAHLSSDFISGFGAAGNLRMARRVLDTARAAGLANTHVYNSYLRACDRAASSRPLQSTFDSASAFNQPLAWNTARVASLYVRRRRRPAAAPPLFSARVHPRSVHSPRLASAAA